MRKQSLSFSSLGVLLTFACVFVAELFRFKGILLLDLWVPLFAFTSLAWTWHQKRPALPTWACPALLFSGVGFASLLIHSGTMSFGDFANATFYGVRWISMAALGLVVHWQNKDEQKLTLFGLLGLAGALSLAGFIQLKVAPDFSLYEHLGWDPHQNRLLSTWFDPNFVGGFFAFILPSMAGLLFDKKAWRPWLLPVALLVLVALGLTLSRSAYLAFIAGMGLFGLIRSRQLLAACAVLGIIMLAIPSPIQSRVLQLSDSIQAMFTETYTIPDASARLRFASWESGWELFLDKPLIGQGYNRFENAALESGLLKDTEIHAASGSDSSLLTLLATTGLLGFAAYISMLILLMRQAWQHRKNPLALGLLCGIPGLLIHSVFVNSLLFPLLMAPFWILVGLSAKQKAP